MLVVNWLFFALSPISTTKEQQTGVLLPRTMQLATLLKPHEVDRRGPLDEDKVVHPDRAYSCRMLTA
jgi:hypothetical protein